MNPHHIMLDLETLDTAPSAVILSIGAVKFDPNTFEATDDFYAVLDLDSQVERGRTISPSTVIWWMRQADAARAALHTPKEVSLVNEVLTDFARWIDDPSGLWGNGADFDNVLLASLYKSFGIKQPWSHRANRCYRTMKAVMEANCSEGLMPYEGRSGVYHNALDDARTQLQRLAALSKTSRIRIM